MATDKTLARRRYSEIEKPQVLAECAQPGASVVRVALAHGINANVVHRWRQLVREDTPDGASQRAELIPLPHPAPVALCPSAAPAPSANIRIELQRGPLALRINCAEQCGAGTGILDQRVAELIRVDAIWLTVEPLDCPRRCNIDSPCRLNFDPRPGAGIA